MFDQKGDHIISISEIDTKILKILLRNGRKSFSEIAQEIEVSQDIVWQHYKKMKKEGIIAGSTIQINYDSLGFNTVGSFTITVLDKKQEEIIKEIEKLENVYRVSQLAIEPKVRVIFILRNLSELEKISDIIKQIPGVLGIVSEIWIGIRNIVENLSLFNSSVNDGKSTLEKNIEKRVNREKIKIDDLDRKIISKLDKNGRLPFSKIAQEFGVSTDTISRRVKRLVKNKIIKPIIQINPSKLGYKAKVSFNLNFISSQKLSMIVNQLSQIPDITLIVKTSGFYDLWVKGYIKDVEHFFSIQKEIEKISGIVDIKIRITKLRSKIPNHSEYISTF